MGRRKREPPANLVPGWPDSPASDLIAETARQFALNLRTALDGCSLRQAAERTGVDHTVIADILNGSTWPDLHTIARLEEGLGVGLWPPHPRTG